MKTALCITLLLGSASMASATLLTDTYAGQNPGAVATNGPDVIGGLAFFDIENLNITTVGNFVNVQIRMNYNAGDVGLGGINVSGFPTLFAGDVLFTNGAQNWALPLIDHFWLATNTLYSVTGFMTSRDIIGTLPGNYRPDAIVWGQTLGAVAIGSPVARSISALGGSEILVNMTFSTLDAAFLAAMNSNATFISFASATCGNDLVTGNLSAGPPPPPPPPGGVPEPASMGLIGVGLAAIGLLRSRK